MTKINLFEVETRSLKFGAGNVIHPVGYPIVTPWGLLSVSALEIWNWNFGAGNEIRTRDPNLGKVVLYH